MGGTVTLGQILDLLGDEDNTFLASRQDMEVIRPFTVGEAAEILSAADEILHVSDKEIVQTLSDRYSREELEDNPRARSAKLRACEKL